MIPQVLVIDNYDSFAYNLVQFLGELGAEIEVFRNDRITCPEMEERGPSHIVISPGPCTPNEAGISMEAVQYFGGRVPLLGVCLGHQSIGQVFGGEVIRGEAPVHGKTSEIYHDGKTLFQGVTNPFTATRYHSLIIGEPIPGVLERTAWAEDGVVMGFRHSSLPALEGVQFHPESILTAPGKQILGNFLKMSIS
ncbi:MAG: aminodeoxychorismate/anthranilate synthase component II [Thermoleophilia bacterium]|nr:aminodeoxychorismate/anthranilate synthase component II [Thermoleophilia bacterium]